MVQTADEPSYIVPPQNWVTKGLWKDNSQGFAAFVQRPPGYGILYLVHYFVLGKSALLGLKWMQIVFFFLSGLVFWKILEEFKLNKRGQLIALTLFMFLPSYSGFVYYSMTEGVTPFFTLWFVLESFQSARTKKASFALFFSFALLLLIRPQLAFLPIAVLIFHVIQRNWKVTFVILASVFPIFLWYVRTSIITGETSSTHPIYFSTNNSLYRPTHSSMTDLYRIWEWRSDVFHTHTGIASRGDSLKIENLRKEIPASFSNEIIPVLHQFGAINQYRIKHFSNKNIKGYFKGELAFSERVNALRAKLIAEHPFVYYIKTPIMSSRDFLNKSYMNLYIFQAPLRGNFVIESLRVICWLFIISSIGLFLLTPFLLSRKSLYFYLFVGICCFLFYLVFVQRLNEERYIVPILPLFLALGINNLKVMFERMRSLSRKSS